MEQVAEEERHQHRRQRLLKKVYGAGGGGKAQYEAIVHGDRSYEHGPLKPIEFLKDAAFRRKT